jgi:hypothetical protein
MIWLWFWLSCVIYRIPLWITLCGIYLFQLNWVVWAYNLNIKRYVLINDESSIGAFLLIALLPHLPCYYPCISFYSYTCWVPIISVLNLAISPCHTNLLLKITSLNYPLNTQSLWCRQSIQTPRMMRKLMPFLLELLTIKRIHRHHSWKVVSAAWGAKVPKPTRCSRMNQNSLANT